mmetsp:Transcript_5111/g.11965  ORF Transcript_5111/g.11965 Transcript_5111/m.11965 type:complete len:89 (+) Transcript_5111:233-499(+)
MAALESYGVLQDNHSRLVDFVIIRNTIVSKGAIISSERAYCGRYGLHLVSIDPLIYATGAWPARFPFSLIIVNQLDPIVIVIIGLAPS